MELNILLHPRSSYSPGFPICPVSVPAASRVPGGTDTRNAASWLSGHLGILAYELSPR